MKRFDLKYRNSFLISLLILVASYAFQLLVEGSVQVPEFPLNVILLAIYLLLLIWIVKADREKPYVIWLKSLQASISALVLFLIQILIMGLFPQDNSISGNSLGFNHVISSWPFLFSLLYLVTCLTVVIIYKCIPFKLKKLAFLLIHLSMWIIIVSIGLGSGDFKRFNLKLYKNEISNKGHWGFKLKLNSFDIENYRPKLALVDITTGKINTGTIEEILPEKKYFIQNYEINVINYLENSNKVDHDYILFTGEGNAPAAQVSVKAETRQDTGWISSGSFTVLPNKLDFGSNSLIMLNPEPKKFISYLDVVRDNKKQSIEVAVNKPATINGWKIYQVNYNKSKGKSSDWVDLELVYDPWLPLVYTGFILLVIGLFLQFIIPYRQ